VQAAQDATDPGVIAGHDGLYPQGEQGGGGPRSDRRSRQGPSPPCLPKPGG
jgi:hypothetical protein